ncbi:cytochrome P450 71B20-like [Papaver somniferum]|uniref:cytochrome P450 71B20-like n=1 Tax=Papaver somniferum TaxID=3469 RepID=UPI000E6F8909|nr:cytochrome P450 71B20-like [Papaver somniferum]
MNWAMTELVKSPKAMKKVQDEIRNYVGSKGKVEESDLDNFPYLRMVVKETLRLHSIASILLRQTMKHSKIDGYDMYPKTWVLINTWAMGRNPEYWPNPEEFLPERFEDSTTDFTRNQNFEYLPFGGGRRVCPGLNTGIVLVELVLANILCSFDWELPKGLKREDLNSKEEYLAALGSRHPLELVPIKHVVKISDH